MWKRLNNQRGSRQSAMIDTPTMDYERYQGHPGLGIEEASPTERGPPPPRPPRDDELKGLPRLPFEPVDSKPPPTNRNSKLRPASSIYSQPSPGPAVTRFSRRPAPSSTYTDDVSPPSSPELSGQYSSQNQYQDHEVSPIDEMPDISRLGFGKSKEKERPVSKPPQSSIPVMRREKRRNQVAAAAANLLQRKDVGPKGKDTSVLYDPYTGERTTSGKGKPQSVKPGEFSPPGLRSVHRQTGTQLGNESIITAGNHNQSFGERVRRLKNSNSPVEKPEWKGGSGRAALVSPVADRFDIPPLSIPLKNTKRVVSPSGTPVNVVPNGDQTDIQSPIMPDPTIRAVLSNSGRSSPRVLNEPTPVHSDASSQVPPRRKVGSTSQHQKKDSADTIERNFREALKESFPTSDTYTQPPSRFSVTTYATSKAESSPRASADIPPPPIPSTPLSLQTATMSSQGGGTPIVNRKRPKVVESPTSITRKAVDPSSPVLISMSSSIATKRASNMTKTLPQSPAEAESHDLITSLQAQLDNLAHRRNNIMKSIRQMTELMPADNVTVTEEVRRKRELEKRKVEGLREEEADIRSKEHELGLKLHRAWKRKDKEAVYEPTGLWVRRVTG